MPRIALLDDKQVGPLTRWAFRWARRRFRVTGEQVAELRAESGDAGLYELTYLVALENFRARSNNALGITAQGFTSGDACPLPWDEQISAAAAPALGRVPAPR